MSMSWNFIIIPNRFLDLRGHEAMAMLEDGSKKVDLKCAKSNEQMMVSSFQAQEVVNYGKLW